MLKYSLVLISPFLLGCPATVYDIAFVGQDPNPDHIRFMDADGTLSDPLFLPNGEAVTLSGHNSLNWSRDGERLIFSASIDGNLDIYSIKSDGTDFQRITDHPERDESPEYSPDGTQIVFLTNRDSIHLRDIYRRELGSGTDTRLTITSNYYLSPTWDASGEKIYYGVAEITKVALYSLDLPTGTVTPLADLPSTAQGLRASPDGTRITFYTAGSPTNVYVINSDGTNQQNLTNSSSFADRYQFPAWYQADQILYTKFGLDEGIYRMNPNGSAKTLIGLYDHAPWSPVYRFEKVHHCASFDLLNAGDEYLVEATVPSLVEFSVADFVWSNGVITAEGKLRVDNRGYAGASGNDVNTRSVTVVPLHTFPVGNIVLRFGELGGTNNVTINGVFSQVADLIDLDGTTVNGVDINVAAFQSGSNWHGAVLLEGSIVDFSIGGEELWIDDYCFDVPLD